MAIIGIDLGGTKVAAALFNHNGDIIIKEHLLLENRSGDEVGDLIIKIIKIVIDKASASGVDANISGIGICVPGIVYSKTGKVWAPNIPGWGDYPLKERVSSAFSDESFEIFIESDRTCYILGEAWRGAAKGCSDAIYLAVGTGIGAGILIDGHIIHGASDIVGATGWMALKPPYSPDYDSCGCFEHYASGNGIATQARIELAGDVDYNGMLAAIPIESVTSHDIFEAYSHNDTIAVRVLERAIEMWGMGTANLVSLFNPEKIIFGGGVFGPAVQFIGRIYEEACRWGQPISMKQVLFTASELGSDAALYGAGYLVLKHKS